jgi:hypothetical protein
MAAALGRPASTVAPVVMMAVVAMDANADAHRADMSANDIGVGRARAQHHEGDHGSYYGSHH